MSNEHIRICKMHSIVTQWVHHEPVLCIDKAYVGDGWNDEFAEL